MSRSMTVRGPSVASPTWAGDYGDRLNLVPGGAKVDPAQFGATDAVVATVAAGGAAQNAVAVPVNALTGAIPSGTILTFGAGKFARLTAAAAVGAVSLAVEALPVALVAGNTGTYAGVEKKTILSGTIVGRTIAERDASTPFGPAVDTDDEIYLLYHDITDANDLADADLYRPNSVVKENFLPGWATVPGALKTRVRALYRCTRGAE